MIQNWSKPNMHLRIKHPSATMIIVAVSVLFRVNPAQGVANVLENAATSRHLPIAAMVGEPTGQNVTSASQQETLRVSLNASSPVIKASEKVTTHAIVSGGTPSYKYEWFDGKRKSEAVAPNVVWTHLGVRTNSIKVIVTDALGAHAEALIEIIVKPAGIASTPVVPAEETPVVSRKIYPGDQEQHVELNRDVSIILPAGAFNQKRTISLSSLTATPLNKLKGFTRLYSYKIDSTPNTFDKEITLAFSYDPKLFTKDSIPPEDAMAVSYWHDSLKQWKEVPFTIDRQNHLLKVKTRHLSDWDIAAMIGHFACEELDALKDDTNYTISNVKNKLNNGLIKPLKSCKFWWSDDNTSDSGVAVSPHFKIHFTAEKAFKVNLSEEREAHLIPGTELIDRRLTNPRNSRNFLVYLLKDYLEQIYQNYREAGFPPFDCKINVYLEKLGGGSPHYSPWTGRMVIDENPAGRDEMETRHEMAHELFHEFQDNDAGISLQGSKQNFRAYADIGIFANKSWFIEATADYAADKIAFSKNHPDGEGGEKISNGQNRQTNRMGSNIMLENYLQRSITTFDERHEYWTAYFIQYLADQKVNFKGMWDAVKTSAGDGVEALSDYIQKTGKKTLPGYYNGFAHDFMFGSIIPNQIKNKSMPGGVVNMHHLRQADDSTPKSIYETIPGNYASYIFAIKTNNRSTRDKTRSIQVWVEKRGDQTAFGSVVWPEGVNGQIYWSKDGSRSDAIALATLNHDKGMIGPVNLEMAEESVAYILMTNGGRNDLPVSIEIREAAITPSPAPTPAPVTSPAQKDEDLQECTVYGFWVYSVTVSFYQNDQLIASTSYAAPKLRCLLHVPPGKYRIVIKFREFKADDPEKTITINREVLRKGINNFSWEYANPDK